MVFSKSKRPRIPRIHINNHQIEITDYVRFLGVLIDSRLTPNINYISTKLRTLYLCIIYKASSILDCNSLKILYVSLFYPHFDYYCEIWGNKYKTSFQCLFILQKIVIRTITHSNYLANTNEIFVKLCVLKLKYIIAYKSYLLAFKLLIICYL